MGRVRRLARVSSRCRRRRACRPSLFPSAADESPPVEAVGAGPWAGRFSAYLFGFVYLFGGDCYWNGVNEAYRSATYRDEWIYKHKASESRTVKKYARTHAPVQRKVATVGRLHQLAGARERGRVRAEEACVTMLCVCVWSCMWLCGEARQAARRIDSTPPIHPTTHPPNEQRTEERVEVPVPRQHPGAEALDPRAPRPPALALLRQQRQHALGERVPLRVDPGALARCLQVGLDDERQRRDQGQGFLGGGWVFVCVCVC